MTVIAEFYVEGVAAPGGSKDAVPLGSWTVQDGVKRFHARFRENGVPIVNVIDSSERNGSHKRWRKAVAEAATRAMGGREPVAGAPLVLEVTFYRARNVSDLGTGRNAGLVKPSAPAYPITQPDATKLLRAAEDAMTGIVYVDDAIIVDVIARKRWATPGQAAGAQICVSGIAELYSDPVPETEGAQLTL